MDPLWNNVILSCPFDSTITDRKGKTITVTGSGVSIAPATVPNGATNALVITNSSAEIRIDAGVTTAWPISLTNSSGNSYTVEMWIRVDSIPPGGFSTFFDNGLGFHIDNSMVLSFRPKIYRLDENLSPQDTNYPFEYVGNELGGFNSSEITLGTWYFLVLEWYGAGNAQNGSAVFCCGDSTNGYSKTDLIMSDGAQTVDTSWLGTYGNTGTSDNILITNFTGAISDLRITKNADRAWYAAPYTGSVPTTMFDAGSGNVTGEASPVFWGGLAKFGTPSLKNRTVYPQGFSSTVVGNPSAQVKVTGVAASASTPANVGTPQWFRDFVASGITPSTTIPTPLAGYTKLCDATAVAPVSQCGTPVALRTVGKFLWHGNGTPDATVASGATEEFGIQISGATGGSNGYTYRSPAKFGSSSIQNTYGSVLRSGELGAFSPNPKSVEMSFWARASASPATLSVYIATDVGERYLSLSLTTGSGSTASARRTSSGAVTTISMPAMVADGQFHFYTLSIHNDVLYASVDGAVSSSPLADPGDFSWPQTKWYCSDGALKVSLDEIFIQNGPPRYTQNGFALPTSEEGSTSFGQTCVPEGFRATNFGTPGAVADVYCPVAPYVVSTTFSEPYRVPPAIAGTAGWKSTTLGSPYSVPFNTAQPANVSVSFGYPRGRSGKAGQAASLPQANFGTASASNKVTGGHAGALYSAFGLPIAGYKQQGAAGLLTHTQFGTPILKRDVVSTVFVKPEQNKVSVRSRRV